MPSFRLRQAGVEDLNLLVRHRRRMWGDIAELTLEELDRADVAYRRWARSRMRSGRLIGFVVETSARAPVASACVWIMPSQPRPGWHGTRVPYLMSMFTEPPYRRRGLGGRILRAALAWCTAAGYDHIVLHTASLGEPLYRKAGFEPSREMRLALGRPPARRHRGEHP